MCLCVHEYAFNVGHWTRGLTWETCAQPQDDITRPLGSVIHFVFPNSTKSRFPQRFCACLLQGMVFSISFFFLKKCQGYFLYIFIILFSLSIFQEKCVGNDSVCLCEEIQGLRTLGFLFAPLGPGAWPCVELWCHCPQEQRGEHSVACLWHQAGGFRALGHLDPEIGFRRDYLKCRHKHH